MKTIKIILTIIVLSSFGSVSKVNKLNKAKWLLGTWEMKTNRGSIYETWEKESRTQFVGTSFMIKDNDTMVFEQIRMTVENDVVFYIPAVSTQNEGNEVRFKESAITDSLLIFENPEHDFPQKIKYALIEKDSLVAEISALKNGEINRQVFPMKKLSN